ncbi:hypothetical protein LV779_32465 [Streptomyces thinghirensis]|nr:hypothetical protein [Streptomyces thinghirensis]
MNKSSTALTGIGQFDVTATPLQMAMVPAASPTAASWSPAHGVADHRQRR